MGFFDIFKSKFNSKEESTNSPEKIIEVEKPKNEELIFDEEIINNTIDFIARKESGYTNYDSKVLDPLFDEAAHLIVTQQQVSASLIQRRFAIGYNRAGRIIDQLEGFGIVGPASDAFSRKVLIDDSEALEKKLKTIYIPNNFVNEEFKEKYKLEINDKIKFYENLIKEEEEEQRILYIEAEKERIKQSIIEKKRKKELYKQAIEELKAEGVIENIKKREPIPQEVQDAVWRRDGGKCVKCGSQENLEFDHIIPFSKGGSNTERNLQLLCQKCNREKSNHIG